MNPNRHESEFASMGTYSWSSRKLLYFLGFLLLSFSIASAQDAISAAGGNGWGKGGKPKPTPTPAPTVDAQQVWKNTAGNTDFNAGASWVSGTAPGGSVDVAAFIAAEVSQPQLTADTSIAGLFFSGTATSGYDLTRSGTQTLTLTA